MRCCTCNYRTVIVLEVYCKCLFAICKCNYIVSSCSISTTYCFTVNCFNIITLCCTLNFTIISRLACAVKLITGSVFFYYIISRVNRNTFNDSILVSCEVNTGFTIGTGCNYLVRGVINRVLEVGIFLCSSQGFTKDFAEFYLEVEVICCRWIFYCFCKLNLTCKYIISISNSHSVT